MKTATELKPRYEENIIETLDIREMLGKYLTKNVYKTWVEEYRNTDTGVTKQIERKELLFNAKTLVTNDEASRINFYIQAGDITKPIQLTDTKRLSYGDNYQYYRPMIVKVVSGFGKIQMLLWADTFEHAIVVATDYLEQKSENNFIICEVKNLGASLIDRNDFYEKQDKQAEDCAIELNPLRFYTMDVIWKEAGTPYPFVRPSKEAKENLRYATFICMAESLDEVKEIVGSEVSRIAFEDDAWKSIEVHYEKGKPLSPSIIVPKYFCDNYRQHFAKIEQ